MKYIVIFLSIFISTSLMAADNTDQQLALEYATLTKMEDMVNTSLKETEQMLKNAPESEREKIHKILENSIGWNAIKSQLIELIVNLYTKEELTAYISFIKTPAGRSFNDKNTEFAKRYSAFLSENTQRAFKECCSQKK